MQQLRPLIALFVLTVTTITASAEHIILAGGPALRKWEDLRVEHERHDRWWANFIRASTLRINEIRKAYGENSKVTWVVYKDGYVSRGKEDGKPYVKWINDLSVKYKAKLIWVKTGGQAMDAINKHPKGTVKTFDYFGHSNKYCFMLDYSAEVMGVSAAYIHQNDLYKLSRGIWDKQAHCQSWGCYTGESMSAVWKQRTGLTLIGANGKTDYAVVGQGKMPAIVGRWVRD